MERHRIFIAINLVNNVKKTLSDYQTKWPELNPSVRWTKKDNLHITLVFLGDVNNQELLDVCDIVKEVGLRHSSFLVNLNKISYGPKEKFPPRMIWAMGEESEEFTSLKDDLSKSLSMIEKQGFSPHVTLGRIKQFEWRQIEPEERPEVNKDINLVIDVESIEVMESELKRNGPEYTVIESVSLSD